jgi:Na+/proline symporter
MNTVAACFLIPLGVSVYVLAGGMRASLIADYSHTIVLYAILLAFAFTVYATSPILGSPARVWELLREASIDSPVDGNAQGSYLTMRSKSGLIFGVLNIVGNFGTGTSPVSERK